MKVESSNQEGLINDRINESGISETPVKPPPKPRLQCLDVFRGLTMAGMILVDNQGNGAEAIWPFHETEWNGISTADMVFPSFLFINGMSIYLAIKPAMAKDKSAWFKILKRVFMLFLIGFLLNLQVKNFNIFHVRIMGVLQRISICYLVVVLLRLLVIKRHHQIMIVSLFPTLYLGLMYGIDVPDCGKGNLSRECNFGGYVDRNIFGPNHMFKYSDPEGLVTTLNAIVNTYLGLSFMEIFQKDKSEPKKLIKNWTILSTYLVVLSLLFLNWMPYNKKIWTTSFCLLTSGISGFTLLICFLFVDYYKTAAGNIIKLPLIWLGMNPLFIFVAMIFLEALLISNIKFTYDGSTISLWKWINDYMFDSWLHSQPLSSLIISIIHLVLWTWIAKIMYDREIFVKL